jgi:hypothetical protein
MKKMTGNASLWDIAHLHPPSDRFAEPEMKITGCD